MVPSELGVGKYLILRMTRRLFISGGGFQGKMVAVMAVTVVVMAVMKE